MPLIQWIMQNLQIMYPSILLGGSSVVTVEYKVVMLNGIVLEGIATNVITQKYCKFIICEKGFFCRYKNDCSCNKLRNIPPRNGFLLAGQKLQEINGNIPSITQCGRKDISKIIKSQNNSLANIPYFIGPPDYLFIAR